MRCRSPPIEKRYCNSITGNRMQQPRRGTSAQHGTCRKQFRRARPSHARSPAFLRHGVFGVTSSLTNRIFHFRQPPAVVFLSHPAELHARRSSRRFVRLPCPPLSPSTITPPRRRRSEGLPPPSGILPVAVAARCASSSTCVCHSLPSPYVANTIGTT